MAIDFESSQTRVNLMRAFASESQARNRYTFAASQAKENKLHVVQAVFEFTAAQEKEHAEIFFDHLKECAGDSVGICGGYPVDISSSVVKLLRYAQHNEYEEHDNVYKGFGDTAYNEGFPEIGAKFHSIAQIERTHGDRFGRLADMLEKGELFTSNVKCMWMCLNCGYIFQASQTPECCPVCSHDRGYFVRLEFSPYNYSV